MAERTAQLAVLNSMLGTDVQSSVNRQAELGLTDLDLKDSILGKDLLDLTDNDARQVAAVAADHGMQVYCLSTQLFGAPIERGQAWFRDNALATVDRARQLAEILQPTFVRLLACQAPADAADQQTIRYLERHFPWIFDYYRKALQQLAADGRRGTIENETTNCILHDVDSTQAFFATLDAGDEASLTWDVQNMWSMGTPPSGEIYRSLRPLIAYVHLKGGQADESGCLQWRSSLRDATWPVTEITAEIVADGASPVICLNPSHGTTRQGYSVASVAEHDIRFLRQISIGIR